jgi:hypothetical protein
LGGWEISGKGEGIGRQTGLKYITYIYKHTHTYEDSILKSIIYYLK